MPASHSAVRRTLAGRGEPRAPSQKLHKERSVIQCEKEDDLINCRARYHGTSQEYTAFSKAMGLPQQRERVFADGLGSIMQGKTEGDRVLVRQPIQEKIYGGDVYIGSDANPVYGPKSPPSEVPEGYAVDVDVEAPKQSAPAQYTDEKIPERFKSAEEEKPTDAQQPPVEDVNNSSIDNSEKSDIIESGSDDVILENQRYGRNKDTLVNKTYIDSGEYKRKYDNATDNPNVNKSLYDCAKAALKHRSGTELEDMYWLDSETGEIIHSVTDSTDKRAIIYTDKLKKAIKGKRSLITIHSHPSSMPPSIDDFNSSFKNGYKVGFVACHNGKVFRYKSEQEVSKTLYNLYINEYLEEGMSEYDAQLNALIKIKENHAIDFSEVL